MIKFVKLLLVLVWLLIILTASNISLPEPNPEYIKAPLEYLYDKDIHLVLFSVLSFLIMNFFSEFKIQFYKCAYIAILLTFFYGITDEWHQGFILWRGVSYYDLLFDVIGGFLGVFIFQSIVAKRK